MAGTIRGRRLGSWAGVLLVLALGVGRGRAANGAAPREARLAYFEGEVKVFRADNTGSDPAQRNMALTEGVRVATGEDGQAEVEFEDGSLVRVTPQSVVVLVRLETKQDGEFATEVRLLNGLIYAEIRAASKFGYRIDAGRDVVTPVANASVRITMDQPPTEVAVFDGTARVERAAAGDGGGGYQVDVARDEALRGDVAERGRYFLSQTIEHNSWDDWNEEREQAAADQISAQTAARDGYAGDQGYGWSDLDANGTWYEGPEGPVWQPFDGGVSGFDPYGYGSWVYTAGIGYGWSSGYAWGWTPFRCGSWNYWPDFGWGWTPGGSFGVGRAKRTNLSTVPPGYNRPQPPLVGGPVRVHPIVPVGTRPGPVDRSSAFQARQLAGTTVMPLRTLGSGYTARGGSAVGSSLRRDYPVDVANGQAVLGVVTAPTGAVRPGAADLRAGERPGVEGADGARRPVAMRPVYPGRAGGAAVGATVAPYTVRPAPTLETVRPIYHGTPSVVRPAPMPMPAPVAPVRSAPPPASRPVAPAPVTSTAPKK